MILEGIFRCSSAKIGKRQNLYSEEAENETTLTACIFLLLLDLDPMQVSIA